MVMILLMSLMTNDPLEWVDGNPYNSNLLVGSFLDLDRYIDRIGGEISGLWDCEKEK